MPLSRGLILKMRNSTQSARTSWWLAEIPDVVPTQSVDSPGPDHKNSPHYRLEIKCEGRERLCGDWTDCLGKYFLDKRYSIVYCLVVVYGHLVLRIYCYLEHNFTRCFTLLWDLLNCRNCLLLTKVAPWSCQYWGRMAMKSYSERCVLVLGFFKMMCDDNLNSQDLK